MNLNLRYSFFNLIKQPQESYESMGRFSSYYLNIYDQNSDKKNFLSWNWVCFFTSFWGVEILWMIYRRMYLYAFFMLLGGRFFYELLSLKIVLLAHGLGGIVVAKSFHWIFRLLFTFGFTVFGNALYFHFLRRKLNQGVKKGGTDVFTPIILFCGYLYVVFSYLPQVLKANPHILELMKQTLGMTF